MRHDLPTLCVVLAPGQGSGYIQLGPGALGVSRKQLSALHNCPKASVERVPPTSLISDVATKLGAFVPPPSCLVPALGPGSGLGPGPLFVQSRGKHGFMLVVPLVSSLMVNMAACFLVEHGCFVFFRPGRAHHAHSRGEHGKTVRLLSDWSRQCPFAAAGTAAALRLEGRGGYLVRLGRTE